MQVLFETGLTSEQYISRQGWREARLPVCPMHPGGGCGYARHGTYERKRPSVMYVARWYCRQAHTTISLLPQFMAARLPGTMAELEKVVAVAEQARSLEKAANQLRTDDVALASAMRWVRRRVRAAHRNLVVVLGLRPDLFGGVTPTVTALRAHLRQPDVLVACRQLAGPQLVHLAGPVGLQPPAQPRRYPKLRSQQYMGTASGTDPP